MKMNKYKQKLSSEWFNLNQLVYLNGSFPANCTKKQLKEELTKLKINWTTKFSDKITKIITTKREQTFKYSTFFSQSDKKLHNLYLNIGWENCHHPCDVLLMIRNLQGKDMGQNSNKILTLLKSSDSVNIDLAVTLIGNHMLESNWIPWLLINKNNKSVRKLLKSNNIPLGRWHAYNTEWNFYEASSDLIRRLNVPDEYVLEFMSEFYEKIKNKYTWG